MTRFIVKSASLWGAVLVLSGCGGSDGTGGHAAPVTDADAAPSSICGSATETITGMTKTGARGYSIEVTGAKPVRPSTYGTNTWQLLVKDSSGAPADGLTLTPSCGMIGHSHGCGGDGPSITGKGNGQYEMSQIVFVMAGQWHIQLDLSGDAGTDSVTFGEFCVQ